jgi:ribosomal-protein-alanine N-acetyltransferase
MRWWEIDELMPLESELFGPDAWSPETFWSELAAPGHAYWVARDRPGARLLGYAGVAISRPTADIQTIAVSPAAQGVGVGGLLLAQLLGHAHAADAREALLEVRADNTAARRLYSDYGFTRIAVRRGYYQPAGIDAIVMRLRPISRWRPGLDAPPARGDAAAGVG